MHVNSLFYFWGWLGKMILLLSFYLWPMFWFIHSVSSWTTVHEDLEVI